MGLDLIISEKVNEQTDDKGRRTCTVVELDNFRGCWGIKEMLDRRQYLENCSTVCYNEGTFFAILNELKALKNSGNTNYSIDREIEQLECFIEENSLKQEDTEDDENDEDYGRVFEVHAWW